MKNNRNTRISCRLSTNEKKILLEAARKNGMDLSALIRLRLKDLPVANQKLQNEFFTVMLDMTAAINKIGVNINQITAGYNRQLKYMEYEAAVRSMGEFNQLFKVYQQTLDRYYFQLNELLKHG